MTPALGQPLFAAFPLAGQVARSVGTLPRPGQRHGDQPCAFRAAFVTRPDRAPISLHLWNDSPAIVACHRDALGSAAQLAKGSVELSGRSLRSDPRAAGDAPPMHGRLARVLAASGLQACGFRPKRAEHRSPFRFVDRHPDAPAGPAR